MVHVLVRHKVEDFHRWKEVFDSVIEFRKSKGEGSARIFQDENNTDMMTGIFGWDSLENAKAFFADAELHKKMKEAGVVGKPEVYFLEEVQ